MATSRSQVSDYSPHLKRVLKHYQTAAVNSLHGPGPNHYLVAQPQDSSSAAAAQAALDKSLHLPKGIQHPDDYAYTDHGYSKQQLYREGGYKKALIYSEDVFIKPKEENCSGQFVHQSKDLFIKAKEENCPGQYILEKDVDYRRPTGGIGDKVGREEMVKNVLPQDLGLREYRVAVLPVPGSKGVLPPPAAAPKGPGDSASAVAGQVLPPASSNGAVEQQQPPSTNSMGKQQKHEVMEGVGSWVAPPPSWVEPGHFLAPPPFPPQPWPVFTTPDKEGHGGQAETLLEGEPIACFTVGGEKRLCLPQILNSVLRDFSLTQINAVCSDLQIYCSRCTAEQLEDLKGAAVLPSSAMSCGLITNTDAQRLTQTLLATHPAGRIPGPPPASTRPKAQLAVYHCCFGKCKGVVWEELYVAPGVPCVECDECHGMFSPDRFVTHAHRSLEKRTCHWGFEADNWRTYLLLAKEQCMPMEKAEAQLKLLKNKFDPSNHKRKKDGTVEAELPKKVRSEDGTLAAPAAAAAPAGVPTYSYDPLVQQYYYRLATSTMPPPWTATPLVTRDGKPLPPPPPAFVRDSFPAPVPAYLSQGPPVLADPGRVVPMSDSQKFERHYQPNVALAPPKVRDKMAREAQYINTQLEKQALYQSNVIENENIKKEECSTTYPSGHSQPLSKSSQQKPLQRPPSPNTKQNGREGLPPPNMSAAHSQQTSSSRKLYNPEDITAIHLTNSSRKLYSPEDITTRHPELELSTTDSDTDSVSSMTQKSEAVDEVEALLRGWSDRAAANKVAQLVADLAARLGSRESEANMLRRRLDAHNKEQNQNMAQHQTQHSLSTRTNKEEHQLREKVSVLEAELRSLRNVFRGPVKQPSVIAAPTHAAPIKIEPSEQGPSDNNC